MTFPRSYLSSAKSLPAILTAIQTAEAPPQFNRRFLESLEFKSPSDRKIIGVLKALKFIRDAYADLFQVNINAQTLTKSELIDQFQTPSQGQLSDSVVNKMTMTFTEL